MALDTARDDEALFRGDVFHHELLHDASVDIANVVFKTEARHAESIVPVGGAEEQILVVGEGVVLAQVLVQVVDLLIL